MKPLFIQPTDDSPGVKLDNVNNNFEIYGESRPEEAKNFYKPIIEWLEMYGNILFYIKKEYPEKVLKVVFQCKFTYFNSPSAKYILDIFISLHKMVSFGCDVTIEWYYQEDNEDMLESGKQYAEIINLPIQLKALATPIG